MNDILIYLSDLLNSLPRTVTLRDTFGRISGYKVQKSELMPINPAAEQIVFSSMPFKVSKSKFKYLGILKKTKKNNNNNNFLPLIESLKLGFKC